ncbi:MAG: hypothetical protein N4A61_02780 [Pelagimonas sp.]|jgi:hypothetical protein|nr:hypothetical protein [Pelagimonas sp.]
MTVWSYKVARDYGFAPNPFHGVCTLACCKPLIRGHAQIGDWIIGAGSQANDLRGKIIYAMIVDETLTFDQYWNDPRYQVKKPVVGGTHKGFFGDNIYQRDGSLNGFLQANSHHSLSDGRVNINNLRQDTQSDRVLLGKDFIYFGANAVTPPKAIFDKFSEPFPRDVRTYKSYSPAIQSAIKDWLTTSFEWGLRGLPEAWNSAIEGQK